MEFKEEASLEHAKNFGAFEFESAPSAGKDVIVLPARKNINQTTRKDDLGAERAQAEISLRNARSLETQTGSPRRKVVHRATSLNAQFLVNISELAEKTFSVDEKASALSSDYGKQLSFSLPLVRASLPADDRSRSLRQDKPQKKDDTIVHALEEEYVNSCSWKKVHSGPTLPISLKFQDVDYKVMVNGLRGSECILQGITGSVHPGEVLALMGPSGGGKTTLLNLLSGRIKSHSGAITYNDKPYSTSIKSRIGFVLQDDITFPHLTVKETLTYAALLRLPNTLSREQKEERANNVISELGLERCQNTVVGGSFFRGISGGERKRVCIGNEVLLNPSLLFLDEPTSGLDSTSALRIVQMLHNIAKAGKTVVTTIHQPSSRLFQKFDKLILLGKGSLLYYGQASEAMPYFSSIGCSPLIAMNPAEFLIDLANGNIKDKSVPLELENSNFPRCQNIGFQKEGPSPVDVHEFLVGACEENVERMKLLQPMLLHGECKMQARSNTRESGASWWQQVSILFRRGLKVRIRDYLSSVRIAQVISTAIIIGLLWWKSDGSQLKQSHDQAALLFFISVFWGFLPLFTAVFAFPQERAMLAKERSVNMYKLSAYFVARNTSDLLLEFILPVVFVLIVYFMTGLKLTFSAFSLSMLTVFLSIAAAQGLGLAIGAAFMDVKKATTMASVVVMTFMLSGGFFIRRVPAFMSWTQYLSFNFYAYRLLVRIQYGCSSPASCESDAFEGLGHVSVGEEVGAMMTMIVGFRLLAYLFLRRMKLRMIK